MSGLAPVVEHKIIFLLQNAYCVMLWFGSPVLLTDLQREVTKMCLLALSCLFMGNNFRTAE
jgi:hypothetical protein